MEYIQSDKSNFCVFCYEASQPDGPENLILYRGKRAYIILNRFPYTSGHLMAVPYEHQDTFENLMAETRVELFDLVAVAIQALKRVYRPQGFNVGINIGEASGAGIAEHIHVHIVPRWAGDTNFMSALSQTRVLPETLEETYRRLSQIWKRG
jgi:ATP adenylyltransferase